MSPCKKFRFSSLVTRRSNHGAQIPGYAQNGRSAINLARLIALLTLR
jgi:hypothetical protein